MIDLTETHVTVSEAAAIAGVDPETVRRWINIRTKKLDATKVGTQWFIRRSDLAAYLETRNREQ